MPASDILVRQHRKVQEIIDAMRERLRVQTVAHEAGPLAALVTQLSGALSTHLAMEDRVLYPKLLASTKVDARQAGARYAEQMSAMAPEVRQFATAWRDERAIAGAPEEFARQAGRILAALGDRMALEERELYPLFDLL